MKKIFLIVLFAGIITGAFYWWKQKGKIGLAGAVEADDIEKGLLRASTWGGDESRRPRLYGAPSPKSESEVFKIRDFIQGEVIYGNGFLLPKGLGTKTSKRFSPDFTTLPVGEGVIFKEPIIRALPVGEGVIFKEPIIRALPFGDRFRL